MNGLYPATIIYSNSKGQITIPKRLRQELEINEKTPLATIGSAGKLILTPIESVNPKTRPWTPQRNKKLLEALLATKGSWSEEDGKAWDEMRKRRRRIELAAARKNRAAW